jgi:hypothetical protein
MAEEEGDYPRDKESGGGMVRRGRRARGGRGGEGGKHIQVYNAQDSEAVKSAEDEEPGFEKGGRAKRKRGGHTEGHEAMMRHDRMPRGRAAQGGKPQQALAAGGKTALKRGGHAEEREEEREHEEREHDAGGGRTHEREHERPRRAAGGAVPASVRLARGGAAKSPYSSGRALSPPETGNAAQRGMEGQRVPAEMD